MKRREFITLVGGAAAWWPVAARAQQSTRSFRIGYLGLATPAAQAARMDALRAGLSDLGYKDGRNTVFEYRWAEGLYERLPHLAMDLVRLDVDVIVTHGTPGVLAAKRATATIPIVMTARGSGR
jgi:putative ABC transport system substrate-binding protein